MMQQYLFSFSLLFIFLHCTKTLSQLPAAAPAQAPPAVPVQAPPAIPVQAPPAAPGAQTPAAQVQPSSGPLDVGSILQKATHFTVFLRLLQATGEVADLNKLLNTTNSGITIFAPNDNAFSSLKAGFLNSLSDDDKTKLAKFHVLPKFIAISQFQTESNPIRTQAGTSDRVSLNVITSGNTVNITTGLTNTSISSTVYTDSQLAIYEVDKVLFPLDIFTPKPPAPAPAPAVVKPKKAAPVVESPVAPQDISGAVSFVIPNSVAFLAVGIVAAALQ